MKNRHLEQFSTWTALTTVALTTLLISCGGSQFVDPRLGGAGAPGASGGSIPVGVPIAIPTAVAGISGTVNDSATGAAVAGVTVTAGGLSTTTNSSGAYSFTFASGLGPAASVLVSFNKNGYVPQARTTWAYTTSSSSVLINVPIQAMTAAQTFDPTATQIFGLPGSTASLTLSANALQTVSGGAPAAGNASVQITPIAEGNNSAVLAGNYIDGSTTPIESFGGLDIRFTDSSGAALSLAPLKTATITIPVSSRSGTLPSTIPLFYFDAATGRWVQQGTASLVGATYQGTVSNIATWSSARFYPTSVSYTGCVVDATNTPVIGATVSTDGINYSSAVSTITDINGNFTLPLETGTTAIVQAAKDIRVSNSVTADGTVSSNNPTCLVLSGVLAVRLTWGASPLDLDSHTLGPGGSHVYWAAKGSLTASPYIALDVDDTTSYGPEVTTVTRLAKSSTYRFFVHNYSNTFSPGQTGSPAKVELIIAGVPRVFAPPSGEGSNGYWHVFDLATDASCGLTLTSRQVFLAVVPSNPNSIATPTYCP